MTISSDTTYELTFTVTDFDVVTFEKINDMLGSFSSSLIIAAHQPDDNNKNTHYHTLFRTGENIPIPSDFPNKSSQEQAARRAWKKRLGALEGVTRIHYGRVKDYGAFAHYILVKCLDYRCMFDYPAEEVKAEGWCTDHLECTCKYCCSKQPKKKSETLTQFEQIIRSFEKDRICQHVDKGICKHCFDDGVIQKSMIKYYLKKKKSVPIGRCAEMMLSAKALLAPTVADKQQAEDDIEIAILAKMQNNLKIY